MTTDREADLRKTVDEASPYPDVRVNRQSVKDLFAERDRLRAEVERLRGEVYEPTKAKLDACMEVGERLTVEVKRLRRAMLKFARGLRSDLEGEGKGEGSGGRSN